MVARNISKLFVAIILIFSFYFSGHSDVYAKYVLPYPSFMPGHRLYPLMRITDSAKKWWSWGSIATFKFHLGMSDKYLIESKTLFEYDQYLLAVGALERSNKMLVQTPRFIQKAKAEGKDVHVLSNTLSEAVIAQMDILFRLQAAVPADFFWQPEKSAGTELAIGELFKQAIKLREELKNSLSNI